MSELVNFRSSQRKVIYWLIPVLLFGLQAVYTFNSLNQIRYEELDESVVNPYWVQNRFVQNGASSNLAWHFLLVLIYNIFGFSLFTGKFVRLVLVLISLLCLASVLKKYLGQNKAWLPLLTIGLSPTFLYFNTQQTVYGIDLVYFPICLYLGTRIDFKKKSFIIFSILTWSFAMIAWMSYPTFIYFLPPLLIFYLYKLIQNPKKTDFFLIKNLLIAIFSFILPLVLAFLYLKNRSLLIYDENVKSGIFRGAGMVDFDVGLLITNVKFNLINLFSRSFGYYYEVKKVEFSDYYPIVLLIFICFAVYKLSKRKNFRLPIFLTLLILIMNIFLAHFTQDPTPGMRRQTGILVTIYILFVFAYYFWATLEGKSLRRWLYLAICFLFLGHHLIVYPINLVHLKDPSNYREQVWFRTLDDPKENLDSLIKRAQKENLQFVCYDESGNPINCRYNQIFAAVSGYCYWNKILCRQVEGYDLKTKKYIPLTIELFNEYYFGRYGKEVIAT